MSYLQAPSTRSRVVSVDVLRGIVMIIMALDHVREFWSASPFRPEDVTQTTTALFFTRWVTHFCAPVFIFLSGVSIYFTGQRLNSKRALSNFLLKRGGWLIVLQVFVLSYLLQFSYNVIILEVIWVIGWSMVLMAALIWLPRKVLAVIAGVLIVGHNAVPGFAMVNASNFVLAMLHNSPAVLPGTPTIVMAYTIIPWVAVMAAGYLAGDWFSLPQPAQAARWRWAGVVLLTLFVVVRGLNVYGDPAAWTVQPRGAWYTFLSFINVTKYPPSLLFLLLTLGVACLALSLLHRADGAFFTFAHTFGQVPFFYYLIHIPLIVLGAQLWIYLSFHSTVNVAFQPPDQWPAGYEPSTLRTYMVWIAYLMLLYFPCKWYAAYKNQNRRWWLAYV